MFRYRQGKSWWGRTAFVHRAVILFARGWKAGSGTGNGPEPVFPWPHYEFTTMKALFQRLLAALHRRAMSNRVYWTQCEFQFSKRVLKNGGGRTVFGRPPH